MAQTVPQKLSRGCLVAEAVAHHGAARAPEPSLLAVEPALVWPRAESVPAETRVALPQGVTVKPAAVLAQSR
jgi:hypothetical protein